MNGEGKNIKDFWGEGSGCEPLEGGRYKVTLPPHLVDIIASTGEVLVKSGFVLEAGDTLVVQGIEMTVTQRERTPVGYEGKHNWRLTVDCPQMAALRAALTYHLADDE